MRLRVSTKYFGFASIILVIFFQNCGEMRSFNSIGSDSGLNLIYPEDDSGNEVMLEGKALYDQSCARCHGSLELSSIRGVDLESIKTALGVVPAMRNVFISDSEISLIVSALRTAGENSSIDSSKPRFVCKSPGRRGLTYSGARRLTQFEIKETVRDLFGEQVFQNVESIIETYPAEAYREDVSEFEGTIVRSLVDAQFRFSEKIAYLVASDTTIRKTVLPSCMFNSLGNILIDGSNTNCVDNFVKDIGLKILRRPLTDRQFSQFSSILRSQLDIYEWNSHRVATMLHAMMMTPEFIHHITTYGQNIDNKGNVDPYSVASRISYQTTGSMPDSALFQAAANKQLLTLEQRRSHAQRLLNSEKGRRFVRNAFYHILHLNDVSTPIQAYGSRISVSAAGLVPDLQKEALDFVEHIVFEANGSFNDLATSNKAFPPSDNASKIFGSEKSNGINDPKISMKKHRGLFMRPVLLLAPETRTSPIRRGLFVNRKVLCNEIPEPDPDSLAQADELEENIDSLMMTAREHAQYVTAAPACQSCHKYINKPGFILEQFGAFGDLRDEEHIYDASYKYQRSLPIETRVNDLLIDNSAHSISDSDEYVEQVAQSTQGQACFVQNVFRYTRLGLESSDDSCHLAELEELVRSSSPLKEVIIQNAISEDQLWEKID